MQRKKMLIAVLAIVLLVGVVSAATISYFGQIKVTTTVSQAVLVDGKSYADMPIEETATVAGGESFCRPHWLKSQTSVPVTVGLYTPPEAGITVTYSTQITDNNTNFGSEDNEVVAFPITSGLILNTLFAGDGLKYTYTVLAGGTFGGASPIIAVLDLADGRHIVLFPGWGARTGLNELQFSETIAYDSCVTNHAVDFVVYDSTFHKIWGSPGSYPAFAGIKTSPLVPISGVEVVTRIAIQHQGANTGETDRLDSLAFGVTTYSFAITEGTPFTLQPLQKLHFVICYKFDLLIQGGTYYIYTTVKPSP